MVRVRAVGTMGPARRRPARPGGHQRQLVRRLPASQLGRPVHQEWRQTGSEPRLTAAGHIPRAAATSVAATTGIPLTRVAPESDGNTAPERITSSQVVTVTSAVKRAEIGGADPPHTLGRKG